MTTTTTNTTKIDRLIATLKANGVKIRVDDGRTKIRKGALMYSVSVTCDAGPLENYELGVSYFATDGKRTAPSQNDTESYKPNTKRLRELGVRVLR